jgi:hypothetical protein
MGPYRYHRIYIPIATPSYQVFGYTESADFTTFVFRTNIIKIIKENGDSPTFDISTGEFA